VWCWHYLEYLSYGGHELLRWGVTEGSLLERRDNGINTPSPCAGTGLNMGVGTGISVGAVLNVGSLVVGDTVVVGRYARSSQDASSLCSQRGDNNILSVAR
jgi:hypothetical protein